MNPEKLEPVQTLTQLTVDGEHLITFHHRLIEGYPPQKLLEMIEECEQRMPFRVEAAFGIGPDPREMKYNQYGDFARMPMLDRGVNRWYFQEESGADRFIRVIKEEYNGTEAKSITDPV